MMRKCTIQLTDRKTNQVSEVTAEFTDEETDLFNVYLDKAGRLADSAWVKTGMPSGLTLNFSDGIGLSAETRLPSWDDVIVFLHKFRPFGLHDERTSFYKVANVLSRRIDHPGFRGFIQEQKDLFSGKHMQSMVQIKSNGVILNSEDTLNKWLNAFEYHQDIPKKELIESLHRILPVDASKPIFCHLMGDRAKAVFNLAGMIELLLGKSQSFETKPSA